MQWAGCNIIINKRRVVENEIVCQWCRLYVPGHITLLIDRILIDQSPHPPTFLIYIKLENSIDL